MRKEYNKLIRDRIPEILDGKDIKYGIHRAETQDEYLAYLLKKVHEEATELQEAITNPHGAMDNTIASEIGDLYEVLDALSKELGLDSDMIGAIQAEKLETNGGFADRIILEWTEENNHSTK